MTLEELERLVIRWVTDVYHQTPIPRLEERFGPGCTPARAMSILKAKYGTLPPPNYQEFADACWDYRKELRKLRHDGISFKGLQFHSDELGQLYRQIGSNWSVEVRYSPLDCSIIRVVDPRDNQNLIEAYNKNIYMSAQSFEDVKNARSNSRRSDGELAGTVFARNEIEIFDELAAKKKSKKMSVRNKAARKQDELDQTKEMASKRPRAKPMPTPVPAPHSQPLTAAPRRRKGAAQ